MTETIPQRPDRRPPVARDCCVIVTCDPNRLLIVAGTAAGVEQRDGTASKDVALTDPKVTRQGLRRRMVAALEAIAARGPEAVQNGGREAERLRAPQGRVGRGGELRGHGDSQCDSHADEQPRTPANESGRLTARADTRATRLERL
ncbi:MAG: hypothetical protein WEE64_03295 [Dehalococcoidia bacterium]